eukprot:SAG31_NODE_17776_length_658_cov_0.917710_1_plen_52_part_01
MALTVHGEIAKLSGELEQYLVDAPSGFTIREEALEWLSAADTKLSALKRLLQ